MNRTLLKPDSQQDVLSAVAFYEGREAGLGKRFRTSLRSAIQLIKNHPFGLPEVEPGVRWVLVPDFPYKVYFLPDESPIPIIAVLHASRHPDGWRPRRS
ncbi:MAG: type II toxin-antitoxin system RelE/ParE family toxin [Planctomycetes bacterium]|nr:type II toxin-antitoxin system RelE/ParE family toxin [Planctomycetota bacterium]MCA8946509.1 type II toxin-antitoxin system RelE/ParE family toxin [Planctomycetota bacterium]